MPKSAKDDLIARIDADIAQVHKVASYVGGDGTPALLARIESDLARFAQMRDYIIGNGEAPAPAEKPKRTRGKGKRGLPEAAKPEAADLTF
jgi:hypothetical protein